MKNNYDINSILNAVDEINLKTKKQKNNILVPKNSTPKLNDVSKISPEVVKLIQEAESYIEKSLFKVPQINVTQKKKNIFDVTSINKTFESIKTQVLEELYTKSKKKVKKNTLKTIFDLHLKIKDLEKKLENFQIEKKQSVNKNKPIHKNEGIDLPIMSDQSIFGFEKVLSKNKNFLKDDVIKTLKIQDSTIAIMKEKINNYKKAEDKLLLQIIDLKHDNILALQKAKKLDKFNDYENNTIHTKENLKSIYKKVEKQKKIFTDLKNYSIKIEQDSKLYKKNYENLLLKSTTSK